MSASVSRRTKALNSKYSIPVEDKPDDFVLANRWRIREKNRDHVILETLQDDDVGKYKKAPTENYISRVSNSYDLSRPEYYDKLSTSYEAKLGRTGGSKTSKSFSPLGASSTVSSGWRPWSRVETGLISSPCEPEAFGREYSRHYTRNYSRPYNTDPIIPLATYSSSATAAHKARYNTTGSYQQVLHRPGRDYKSRLGGDYGVKSYNEKSHHIGRDRKI